MPIILDNDTFEQRQLQFLRDLLLVIKDELENADLDPEQVAELTGKIGLAVASTIDGGADGETDSSSLPRLTFSAEEGTPDSLIVNDRGTYLHELAYSLFAEVLGEDEFDDEDEELDEDEYMDDEDLDEDDFEEDEEDEDGDEDENADDEPGSIH